MNDTASVSTRSLSTIRWIARIFGALAMAVLLFFYVADCITKGRIAIASEAIPETVFLFLSFIGLIIAWKWEGIGGALALAGSIGFYILAPVSLARAGVVFTTVLYGLPALLFVYCWWKTRRQVSSKAA